MIVLCLTESNQRLLPVLIWYEANCVSEVVEPFGETFPVPRVWVVKVKRLSHRLALQRQVHNCPADVIHGRNLDVRICNRHAAQLNTAFKEAAKEIVRIPCAGLTVAGDQRRPVNRYRQTSLSRRAHHLLGYPLA